MRVTTIKLEYKAPVLSVLGHISDLTEANNTVYESDVPLGTNGDPNVPGGGLLSL